VFGNRVLRGISGPKRDEMTGGLRKLHNEELQNLYSSPRWAGHVARMGAKRNAYRILVGKPEGKRALGRPRHRWVDIREIGWDGMDRIDVAQDSGPVEGSCEHGNEPSGSIKCW
jgi:hypothetical protein